MNKICIDTRKYALKIETSGSYSIDVLQSSDITIHILDNLSVKISFLTKENQVSLHVSLGHDSKVIINSLGIDSSINYTCNLFAGSELTCVSSILTSVDSFNNIFINHKEGNSHARFYANGINKNIKKLYFLIDGVIPKNSLHATLEESSKIINLALGDSKIVPNLIVDNKEVIANHAAFIGTLNKEDIWYLKSRGIKEIDIKKLLFKSILLGKMEKDFKERFIKILLENNNIERGVEI